MLCACVDIGSNTTRLLVAEPRPEGLREVLSQRSFTRIARGLGPDGEILGPKLAEVAEVVAAQVAAARTLGADHLRIVATAAIRSAPNGADLCAVVAGATGERVDVLTGQEEASLAFLGATATLERPAPGAVGVVDVGGGSTELAVGTPGAGVSWFASLPVGSGVLAAEHLHSDPPEPGEVRALRAAAAAAFAEVRPPATQLRLAVGGSATSVRRLVGAVLDARGLGDAVHAVCDAPAGEVAARYALEPERVRLLPAGLAVLEQAAGVLGGPLEVANGGLREGVLLAAARAG